MKCGPFMDHNNSLFFLLCSHELTFFALTADSLCAISSVGSVLKVIKLTIWSLTTYSHDMYVYLYYPALSTSPSWEYVASPLLHVLLKTLQVINTICTCVQTCRYSVNSSVFPLPALFAMHYALFHHPYLFISVSLKIKMNGKLAPETQILQQKWESVEVVKQEAFLNRGDHSD